MIEYFKNCFFNGEKVSTSITKSAALIALMGVVSRLLGLLRDRIFASKFGAGDVMDSYYAAFKIPDLMYSLLIMGALSAAFVPVFSSLISKKKKKEAWELANILISVGVLLLSLIAILIYFFAPSLIDLMAFGYSDEKQAVVTQLTRIMLLSPIILGISGIIGGVLNSFRKFFFYSLAPIFYNLGIIFGAVFLFEVFGSMGLALGVILGAILHLGVQVPELIRSGFHFRPVLDFKNKNFRKVATLMVPRMMGVAITQLNFFIVIVLASTLESGRLAIFNFANNLQSVPLGVFGISFAIASFPILSCLWAEGNKKEFIASFMKTFRKIVFLIVPFSAFLFIFRAQIVRVILGTGRFDWEATELTFAALGIFTFSLWAQSIIPLLARTFYAIQDTKTPFFSGLFSEIVNLSLSLYLIKYYGILGIVWAFSASMCINAITLLVIFRIRVGTIKARRAFMMFLKTLLATLFAVAIAQFLKELISDDPFGAERTFLGVFTQLAVASTFGGAVFIISGKLLEIKELDYFLGIAKRRARALFKKG